MVKNLAGPGAGVVIGARKSAALCAAALRDLPHASGAAPATASVAKAAMHAAVIAFGTFGKGDMFDVPFFRDCQPASSRRSPSRLVIGTSHTCGRLLAG